MAVAADVLREACSALQAAGIDGPRLDAELLLAAAWQTDRTGLVLRRDQQVPPAIAVTFDALLQRRLRREPVSYILGEREFWSLSFQVTCDVLVPRPETELLVERTVALARGRAGQAGASLRLCDIGTGSGCIAIALAHELPAAEIWAVDVSPAALAVAEENARRLGVASRLHFVTGDLLDTLPGDSFDFVVSNPPYVTTEELAGLAPELDFEPRLALDGGADGLAPARRLAQAAPRVLRSQGWLLFEIGIEQEAAALALVAGAPWECCRSRADLSGRPRAVEARRA